MTAYNLAIVVVVVVDSVNVLNNFLFFQKSYPSSVCVRLRVALRRREDSH